MSLFVFRGRYKKCHYLYFRGNIISAPIYLSRANKKCPYLSCKGNILSAPINCLCATLCESAPIPLQGQYIQGRFSEVLPKGIGALIFGYSDALSMPLYTIFLVVNQAQAQHYSQPIQLPQPFSWLKPLTQAHMQSKQGMQPNNEPNLVPNNQTSRTQRATRQ